MVCWPTWCWWKRRWMGMVCLLHFPIPKAEGRTQVSSYQFNSNNPVACSCHWFCHSPLQIVLFKEGFSNFPLCWSSWHVVIFLLTNFRAPSVMIIFYQPTTRAAIFFNLVLPGREVAVFLRLGFGDGKSRTRSRFKPKSSMRLLNLVQAWPT